MLLLQIKRATPELALYTHVQEAKFSSANEKRTPVSIKRPRLMFKMSAARVTYLTHLFLPTAEKLPGENIRFGGFWPRQYNNEQYHPIKYKIIVLLDQ